MECATHPEKLICCLDERKYVEFCKSLNLVIKDNIDFKIFQEKKSYHQIIQLCADIFKDEVEHVISCTSDPYIGIAALDIPESISFDRKSNSVYGASVTMGIFGNIGEPNIDSANNTPFTIYSSSHENAKLLDSKGLTQYAPEVKLGFHNDGLFRDEIINIPLHIMVYNMYINYKRPGNFKWLSIANWDDAEKYENLLKDRPVKIKITPNYFFDKEGNIKNTLVDMVEVPICQVNEHGKKMFFLNGNVLAQDNGVEIVELVNSMRDSISKSPTRILIEQKERRAFFLKNDFGFHARDIFEEPFEDADLTRVFIRAVDVNAQSYSSY